MRISDWSSDVCSSDLGRDDLTDLSDRVEELTAELRRQGGSPARRTGARKATVRKSAVRKDTAAKKKAPAKKAAKATKTAKRATTRKKATRKTAAPRACSAPAAVANGRDGHRFDRTSVVSGKSVSLRVDLGGRRIMKKKQKNKT